MKRTLFFFVAALCCIGAAAQRPEISPVPQQAEWGDVAFAHGQKFYLVGADKADTDAVQLLMDNVGICDCHQSRPLLIGERTDKAVKAYKKLIPQHPEGYYLHVGKDAVVVAGYDEEGTYYGVQTLLRILDQPQVQACTITDWPSVACRGVIEGFYGNPWSHQDRLRQFDFYGRNKMNTYVYGPKDDPYHRAHWRDPYPEAEARQLRELVEAAHRNKVQFVWAVHPGGDIQWNAADSAAVVRKLEAMYDLGVRTFAVFFDDIWGEGAKGDKQAGLMNYITDNFVRKHKGVRPLILCPTQYNKGWSSGDYLTTLGATMYPEVRIMWTGNSVVDMIQKEDMEWINGQIGRKAFIWLNWPVNDYVQSRLLMGPTYGNGLDIADLVSGFCSNPMEYAEASKVSLFSIADYTWNMPRYDADKSWELALRELMPISHPLFRLFCEQNIDLGPNGHGMRRDGESKTFAELMKSSPEQALIQLSALSSCADMLLADSINEPEMLAEIGPWVRQMGLVGQRACQLLLMKTALQSNDSVAFIGHYRSLQQVDRAQKAIVSRNYEGSIVKAKPVVGGTVILPFLTEQEAAMVKGYKQHHQYGREFFPVQSIDDGDYLILCNGRYLTDAQAAAGRVGDAPVFQTERDVINPQRQLWTIELEPSTGRYKIVNKQDGRYLNELGRFWKDRDLNPYNPEWHTFTLTRQEGTYTIQCGGRAGNGFWTVNGDGLGNGDTPARFEIVKPQ
ncbi:MAG: beta-N-acetylglucosaminidase domain-containing protein [Bacteroidaceae bacterium]|nr:beta-N-acetylglucosaminidase domain-containing protein [Bacteroidaceae bacterium]